MVTSFNFVDSWKFNRGQTISLLKGPKQWQVTVQLYNTDEFPFKYLRGLDKEKLLFKALALIKKDVAKDGQKLTLRDLYHDHGTNMEPFPITVHTESEDLEDWKQSPEFQYAVDKIVENVQLHRLHRLEEASWEDE